MADNTLYAVMVGNSSIFDPVTQFIYLSTVQMKGTKVQTLGARAVAGAWCMAGCLLWPWVQ